MLSSPHAPFPAAFRSLCPCPAANGDYNFGLSYDGKPRKYH
jgi:hypothetical protein